LLARFLLFERQLWRTRKLLGTGYWLRVIGWLHGEVEMSDVKGEWERGRRREGQPVASRDAALGGGNRRSNEKRYERSSACSVNITRRKESLFFRRFPLVVENVEERTVRMVYDFVKRSYGPPSPLLKRVLRPSSFQAFRLLLFSSSYRASISSPRSAGPPPRRPERQLE
jgi:hypothetical protein